MHIKKYAVLARLDTHSVFKKQFLLLPSIQFLKVAFRFVDSTVTGTWGQERRWTLAFRPRIKILQIINCHFWDSHIDLGSWSVFHCIVGIIHCHNGIHNGITQVICLVKLAFALSLNCQIICAPTWQRSLYSFQMLFLKFAHVLRLVSFLFNSFSSMSKK